MHKVSTWLIHGIDEKQTFTQHSHMYKLPVLLPALLYLAAMIALPRAFATFTHVQAISLSDTWCSKKQTFTQNCTHVQATSLSVHGGEGSDTHRTFTHVQAAHTGISIPGVGCDACIAISAATTFAHVQAINVVDT